MGTIYALSDSHGYLPPIPDDAKLVLHAGDAYGGPRDYSVQYDFFVGPFREWVSNLDKRGVQLLYTPGNHDEIIYARSNISGLFRDFPDNFTLLIDEMIEIENVKIWGSPWTPIFGDWGWMASEIWLDHNFKNIPDELDILISHGPPFGILDSVPRGHAGSKALRAAIAPRKISHCVFGHIHEGGNREMVEIDGTKFYNVSYVDEGYFPWQSPVRIDL